MPRNHTYLCYIVVGYYKDSFSLCSLFERTWVAKSCFYCYIYPGLLYIVTDDIVLTSISFQDLQGPAKLYMAMLYCGRILYGYFVSVPIV